MSFKRNRTDGAFYILYSHSLILEGSRNSSMSAAKTAKTQIPAKKERNVGISLAK
jgi:hypothetical protein